MLSLHIKIPSLLCLTFVLEGCSAGGDCLTRVCREGNLEGILEQRATLWGPPKAPAPTAGTRKRLLWDFQFQFWDAATKEFRYHFLRHEAPASHKGTIVCQDAWLHLLGFSGATSQFKENAKLIKQGLDFDSGTRIQALLFRLEFVT
jgi:hypothetical protein